MLTFTQAGDSHSISVSPRSNGALAVQVASVPLFTGSLVVEVSLNGEDWVQAMLRDPSTDTGISSFTSAGIGVLEVTGYQYIRIRAATLTDGSIGVDFRFVPN